MSIILVPLLLLFILLDWITVIGALGIGATLAILIYWDQSRPGEKSAANDTVADNTPRPTTVRQDVMLSAFRQFPEPILWLDDSGSISLANDAATQHFREGLIERHITSVLRAPEVIEAINQVLAGAETKRVSYSEPVPVERHFEAIIAPIVMPSARRSNDAADASGALLVLRDFTAIKRTDRMRADFVANSSHELRTPLASLNGFIETLRGPARDDPEARDRFLSIMEEQARRMGRLIDDLLSLGRIELNEHVLPRDPVNLIKVAEEVKSATRPQARKKGIEVTIRNSGAGLENAGPESVPLVPGDRDELYQVLQNLVDNAIKYGKPEGHVTIEFERLSGKTGEEPRLKMSVIDDGEGIQREHIPRLTERFYRVDVQRSRDTGGTGLGLAIVKHIVNRHRGQLSIESTVGVGSTFTVILPLLADRAKKAPNEPTVIKV